MSSLKHKDQIDPEADTGHQNFGFQNEMEGNSTREDTNHSNKQELVVDDLIHKDIDGNENDYFVSIKKSRSLPRLTPFIKKFKHTFSYQSETSQEEIVEGSGIMHGYAKIRDYPFKLLSRHPVVLSTVIKATIFILYNIYLGFAIKYMSDHNMVIFIRMNATLHYCINKINTNTNTKIIYQMFQLCLGSP